MTLTDEQIRLILSQNKDPLQWAKPLHAVLPKYDIQTPKRVAGFFSQTCVESLDFTVLAENLNYSAKGLNAVFPKYFERAGRDAEQYHRQPEKIANVVYADRMGNGNTESGDGWKFRGRGLIQLTGRDNYTRFAKDIGLSVDEAIGYLETPKGALESACWFWRVNNLNKICDDGDIVLLSKRVNGGTNGLDHRKHKWEEVLKILGGEIKEEKREVQHRSCKIGSRGDHVAAVQAKLGVKADGVFGPGTEGAVKKFQSKMGLVADGIVGAGTLKALFG